MYYIILLRDGQQIYGTDRYETFEEFKHFFLNEYVFKYFKQNCCTSSDVDFYTYDYYITMKEDVRFMLMGFGFSSVEESNDFMDNVVIPFLDDNEKY